ncbi:MAG: hypothetical protein ACKKMW_02135 [Candidatus Nealsonbacteria bacterium]
MKRQTFIKIIAGLTILANVPSAVNKSLLAFLIDATFSTAINVVFLMVIFMIYDFAVKQIKSIKENEKEKEKKVGKTASGSNR